MEEQPSATLRRSPEEWGAKRFFNRQLSWLEFNRRVLGEAHDTRHPLIERAKFLAIFSSNLDEFFMVRVSGIQEQIVAGVVEPSPDGLSPDEQLALIKPVVDELAAEQHHCWSQEIMPELRRHNIFVYDYAELQGGDREVAAEIFHEQIFPVLTPLAFDPGHPFPHISNLSLNLAVVIRDPTHGERFARVKVPSVLHRLVQLPAPQGQIKLIWLEQLIAAHIEALFPGHRVAETYPFKITRDADVDLQEEEANDLLETVAVSVRQRHFGHVVRLTVDPSMPQRILDVLIENLEITPRDVYRVGGPMKLSSLMELGRLDRPDLKYPPFVPVVPPELNTDKLFAAIQRGDHMLHLPYESFDPIIALIEAAADDPHVLAIKQTLYRVGRDAPIVAALQRARLKGKQVTVLVEIKARFDEENNIEWANKLEEAGVHVVYGLVGLKTHAKIALIVRKEDDGLRTYVHLSTGNYNAVTARLYTDIGLLTRDPDFGSDATDLFNYLTGYSAKRDYRCFFVAPVRLRQRLVELIDREIALHEQRGGGRLIFKMNTLTDVPMIDALYRASAAGVEIDLIIRGVCCLRPGVPGLSETIRVRSIIGRFLEHSRIYLFGNGGDPEIYLGSADLMSRNLDRRVETVFPVREPALRRRVRGEILDTYLNDTANAHLLRPDGEYCRPAPEAGTLDSQSALLARAAERAEQRASA